MRKKNEQENLETLLAEALLNDRSVARPPQPSNRWLKIRTGTPVDFESSPTSMWLDQQEPSIDFDFAARRIRYSFSSLTNFVIVRTAPFPSSSGSSMETGKGVLFTAHFTMKSAEHSFVTLPRVEGRRKTGARWASPYECGSAFTLE